MSAPGKTITMRIATAFLLLISCSFGAFAAGFLEYEETDTGVMIPEFRRLPSPGRDFPDPGPILPMSLPMPYLPTDIPMASYLTPAVPAVPPPLPEVIAPLPAVPPPLPEVIAPAPSTQKPVPALPAVPAAAAAETDTGIGGAGPVRAAAVSATIAPTSLGEPPAAPAEPSALPAEPPAARPRGSDPGSAIPDSVDKVSVDKVSADKVSADKVSVAPPAGADLLRDVDRISRTGDTRSAIGTLEAHVLHRPEDPSIDEMYYTLGTLYEREGEARNFQAAFSWYRRLIETFPQSRFHDRAMERAAYIDRHFLRIR